MRTKANNGDSCNLVIPYYAPGTVNCFTNINPFSLTVKLKEGICVGKKKIIYILEEGMTTHSSILAGRVPGRGESGGLQSMGSQSDMTEST